MRPGPTRREPTRLALAALLPCLAAAIVLLGCDSPERREARTGRALYEANCAKCHGRIGRGEGPTAAGEALGAHDLRTLTRRLGPPCPRSLVAAFIDGREDVAAHGPRDMPAWGDVFYRGWPEGSDREAARAGNIALLVDYLESVQVE
jgi:mono/diheme cytochrome c family protein